MNLRPLNRNALWNLAGSAVPMVAAVLTIPYMLKALGAEAFGVLTLVWALIGYFSLFDLGVGRALTYQLSRLVSLNSTNEVSPTLQAGLVLTTIAGMLGALIVWLLAPALAGRWLGISTALQADAALAFVISAVGVLPTTIASGLRGALEGLERFAASNISRIFLGLWMFILPAVAIYLHGPQLWSIAIYLVLGRGLVVVAMAWQLRSVLLSRAVPMVRRHLGALWSYGLWVTVTGIVGPLMIYGDRFFVSAAVGATQLPFYAIPQEGLLRLLIIPVALTGALMPRMSALNGNAAMDLYRHSLRRIVILMFVVCLAAAALAYPLLGVWLSFDFASAALPVVLVLCAGIWVNSIALVPYTLLHSRGNPRITAIFHLAELFIYVGVLWILTAWLGLLGAALAWLFRVVLDLALLSWAVRRLSAHGGKY